MRWLDNVAEQIIAQRPDGEIVVSSGVSPSGVYHVGTLREILTAEAIARELRRRGRRVRHLHVVDDHDVFRKVPAGVSESFADYLGMPLSAVPSPDGDSKKSYADYYLQDLLGAAQTLHLDLEILRSDEQYKQEVFTEAIEKVLENKAAIRTILQDVSGRKLDEHWSPIQVNEKGRLKNRRFVRMDKASKTLVFINGEDQEQSIRYAHGEVKLSWRVDWPARWWLLGVNAEPFGRDHATKGGSYDTGAAIVRDIFDTTPPVPLPYNFINRTGDTKKMSKSAGDTITITELLKMLPAEVIWFFVTRYAPDKQLFFDAQATLIRLIDEFGELLAKTHKSEDEQKLVDLCMHGVQAPTVSRVPFSHLVASYQAALKDTDKTLDIISRTEYTDVVQADGEIIKNELRFIDQWLQRYAPEDVQFALSETIDIDQFSESEKAFLRGLGEKVTTAPDNADGAWFHERIYELKDKSGLSPKDMFATLYRALIGKSSGPRAGWFLSILPRDWLIKRLALER